MSNQLRDNAKHCNSSLHDNFQLICIELFSEFLPFDFEVFKSQTWLNRLRLCLNIPPHLTLTEEVSFTDLQTYKQNSCTEPLKKRKLEISCFATAKSPKIINFLLILWHFLPNFTIQLPKLLIFWHHVPFLSR